MTFIPETREVRVYFYDPHNASRTRVAIVQGWHLHGINARNPKKTGEFLSYGIPVIADPVKGLTAVDTASSAPDFLGVSFHPKDGEEFRRQAKSRWGRENAAHMKKLAEQLKAHDAEQSAKAAEEKAAQEAAEKAKADAVAEKNARAERLANADTIIYGD